MKDLFGNPLPLPDPPKMTETDLRSIMLAMALLWTSHPRTTVYNLLRKLEFKNSAGRYFTQEDVKLAGQQLLAKKQAIESTQRHGS